MREIDDEAETEAEAEFEESEELEEPLLTAEPEEIAPADILPGEVIVPEDDGPKGHLTELVCDCCLELNLVTKSVIKCPNCEQAFCLHFASTIDAQYCVNCMSDMSVTKQIITKTYEHRNAETGETKFYRRNARSIKIEGLDWLFSQRKIYELNDEELDLSIEYHRNIMQLMLMEQEQRRVEKLHRYANVVIKAPPSAAKVTNTTVTTTKKTRTVTKDKAAEQLQALMRSMLAKGLTPAQIQAMFKK